MHEQHIRFYSHILQRDVEMLVHGQHGYPVVIFPTTWGRFFEAKDRGLIEAARWFVDRNFRQLWSIDAFTDESWYNKGAHPGHRAWNHVRYDRFLNEEFIPQLQERSPTGKVAVAGASFGGYQAANFAFKHPDKVSHLFTMSGAFDIRNFTDGYYDENIYFNNPVDFLPGANDPNLWQMKIILGTSEWDICLDSNMRMARVLRDKNIPHWLDVRGWQEHDWPLWREMFPDYLSRI